MRKKILLAVTVPESLIFLEGVTPVLFRGGFEVLIACNPSEFAAEFCKKEGAIFIPIPMVRSPSLINDLKSLYFAIRALIKYRPKIVNAGTPKAGFIFTLASFLCFVPLRIYHVRGFRHESMVGVSRLIQIFIEKICGMMSTKVLLEANSLMSYAVNYRIFSTKKCVVLGMGSSGIDFSNFDKFSTSENFENSLAREINFFYVGYLGRMIPRKGVDDLVDAWKLVSKRHSNVKLRIAGPLEEHQALKSDTTKSIASDNSIEYLGPLNYGDVPSFMSNLNLFVLPAHWEGFGNVLIEAAHCGIPVISCWGNGTKDAVRNGFNGILIEPKNPNMLADVISMYINSPQLCSLHGLNGVRWAENFDRRSVSINYLNFYNSMLN